jgi:hypothetical protein
MEKATLLAPPTNGNRRTARLMDDDEAWQVSAAVLFDGKATYKDGSPRELLQIKVWNWAEGWYMYGFADGHSLAAMTGPYAREGECWKAFEAALKRRNWSFD